MTDDIPEVHALFLSGREIGDWVWCLHCQRCYKIGEYRLIDDLQMCPYEGCNGDTVLDSIEWRGEGEPVRGKVYDYNHKPAD